MTKDELSQIHFMNIEIKALRKQLESIEIKCVSDTVIGSSKHHPYTQHPIAITGFDWSEYERKVNRISRQINRKIAEMLDRTAEINEYIASLPDSEIRLILSLRYVNGLDWKDIATHIGEKGDGSTQRKKHNRFLGL